LYSPRGAVFRARAGVRFAVVLVERFTVVLAVRCTVVLALRFAVVLALRAAPFAEPRFAADFLADVGRVLLAVRLVAMSRSDLPRACPCTGSRPGFVQRMGSPAAERPV
jgi:hypothetical protein